MTERVGSLPEGAVKTVRFWLREFSRPLGEGGCERSEQTEGVSPAARLFPQETSAADVVAGHDPSCEKGILKSPQAFQNPELKIIIPLTMRRATRSAFKSSCPQTKTPALRGAERERRVFGDYLANSGVDR